MMTYLHKRQNIQKKHTLIGKNQGFTLVELIVTLAIAGVIMSYAIPTYREFTLRQGINNNANNLVIDITFARVSAVKQGRNVVIESKSGVDWSSGWRIFLDGNADNTFGDASDVLLRNEDSASGVTMSGTGSFITFDGLGSIASSGVFSLDVSHTGVPSTTISVGLSGVIKTSS